MLRNLALAFTVVLLPTVTWGGPFGFDVTSEPDPQHCKPMDVSMWYKCETVPNPHPDFEAVIIQYHPDLGFCFLKGVGRNVQTNSFGSNFKIMWEKISNQVSSVYGQPSKQVDRLLNGSIWDEPEDYMMSMLKEERVSLTLWETDPTEHSFNSIALTSKALSTETAYLNIEYYFPNSDDCDNKINEKDSSSF